MQDITEIIECILQLGEKDRKLTKEILTELTFTYIFYYAKERLRLLKTT